MHKAHVADTRKHKRRTASGKIVDVRRHKKTYKLGFKPVQTKSETWYALDTSKIEANPWVQEAWEEVLGDKSLVPRTLRKKLPKNLTLMLQKRLGGDHGGYQSSITDTRIYYCSTF